MGLDAKEGQPLIMYDPKSQTVYLEWRRGVVARSLEFGTSLVFDFDEDGVVLGTECFLTPSGVSPGQPAAAA